MEANVLRTVNGHRNIISFFGVTIDRDKPVLVTGLAMNQNLNRQLFAGRIPRSNKLRLCYEIALGVAHIHSLGIIHRDLATRNVVLSAPRFYYTVGTAKITDFGMAAALNNIGVFQAAQNSALPVVWSPPEALESWIFLVKSDVWSLGVLIWEIFEDGTIPYMNELDHGRVAILNHLRNNRRLGTDEIPADIVPYVSRCWEEIAANRPSAHEIAAAILVTKEKADSLFEKFTVFFRGFDIE